MDTLPAIPDDLVRRYDVAGPRYTSYPTVPTWSERFGAADYARALETAAQRRPEHPLSLYVHLPFCRQMCTYCGCNVVATRDGTRADRYLAHLERELALTAEHLGARRSFSRLHLGGGTPTFLDERQLARLWELVTARFTVAPDAELAVEVDPKVTTRGQLALLAGFGFRRISLGVQDLDPEVQLAVRRVQTLDETRASVEDARALGFRSVNLDLIYGLPRQTPASFARTMEAVASLRPDRVAVFSFAFVPEVRPNQRRLNRVDMATGPAKLALLRVAWERLAAAGYRAIGFDHFALPDDELARAADVGELWRDFQGYTVHKDAETIAFGMSGISDLGFAYAQSHRMLGAWEDAVAAGRLPTARGILLSADDRVRRRVITALLCNLKVSLTPVEQIYFASELAALAPLEADGLVQVHDGTITVTPLGRPFLRNVALPFDAWYAPAETRFSRTV